MRILPRSLLARTVLTIAVLLLASQAAWFELWRAYEREPRARQIAQRAAGVVTLTRAALLAAHPDRRRGLLEELSRTQGIRGYPIEPDELIHRSRTTRSSGAWPTRSGPRSAIQRKSPSTRMTSRPCGSASTSARMTTGS